MLTCKHHAATGGSPLAEDTPEHEQPRLKVWYDMRTFDPNQLAHLIWGMSTACANNAHLVEGKRLKTVERKSRATDHVILRP